MRRHEHKARRSEAAGRMIGPSTTVQLVRRTLLDPATVRDAVLMGPMPANIAPSMLDAETAPITVTSMSSSRANGEQRRLKIVLTAVKVSPLSQHLKGARNRRWIWNSSSAVPVTVM